MNTLINGLAVVGFFSLMGFVLVIVCLTRSEEEAKEVLWGYCWTIWIIVGGVMGLCLIGVAYAAVLKVGEILYNRLF